MATLERKLEHQDSILIRPIAGVYALVFQLRIATTITFDRRGTQHRFLAGWYIYIGSARGSGGVKQRIERHRKRLKSGKRRHWNVDYLREYAELEEVWYSYTNSSRREHDWANLVGKLTMAQVPVDGFGASDCDHGCRAHLFYFPQRPFVAEFRVRISSIHSKHPSVWAEVIDSAVSPRASDVATLRDRYELARHFLERRRVLAHHDGIDGIAWKSLARGRPARQLAEHLAAELAISCKQLMVDINLAVAIECIVDNCGQDALQAIFHSHRPQLPKAILRCSRKSREVQYHRIASVLNPTNRAWSLAPQGQEKIPDTMNFAKILSRLERARGSVEATLRLLSESRGYKLTKAWIAEVAAILVQFEPLIAAHEKGLHQLEVKDSKSVPRRHGISKNKMSLHQVPVQLKAALGLIEKNIRDMPQSSYDLRPTHIQWQEAIQETNRIRTTSRKVLKFVPRE